MSADEERARALRAYREALMTSRELEARWVLSSFKNWIFSRVSSSPLFVKLTGTTLYLFLSLVRSAKAKREQLSKLRKQYDKTEDDLKALQVRSDAA
jgi:hypothetical protein